MGWVGVRQKIIRRTKRRKRQASSGSRQMQPKGRVSGPIQETRELSTRKQKPCLTRSEENSGRRRRNTKNEAVGGSENQSMTEARELAITFHKIPYDSTPRRMIRQMTSEQQKIAIVLISLHFFAFLFFFVFFLIRRRRCAEQGRSKLRSFGLGVTSAEAAKCRRGATECSSKCAKGRWRGCTL